MVKPFTTKGVVLNSQGEPPNLISKGLFVIPRTGNELPFLAVPILFSLGRALICCLYSFFPKSFLANSALMQLVARSPESTRQKVLRWPILAGHKYLKSFLFSSSVSSLFIPVRMLSTFNFSALVRFRRLFLIRVVETDAIEKMSLHLLLEDLLPRQTLHCPLVRDRSRLPLLSLLLQMLLFLLLDLLSQLPPSIPEVH